MPIAPFFFSNIYFPSIACSSKFAHNNTFPYILSHISFLTLCPTTWQCHPLKQWRTRCLSCLRSTSSKEKFIFNTGFLYLINRFIFLGNFYLINWFNVGVLEWDDSFRCSTFSRIPPANLEHLVKFLLRHIDRHRP